MILPGVAVGQDAAVGVGCLSEGVGGVDSRGDGACRPEGEDLSEFLGEQVHPVHEGRLIVDSRPTVLLAFMSCSGVSSGIDAACARTRAGLRRLPLAMLANP